MLKNGLVISLSLLLLLQVLNLTVVYTFYHFQKDYITETFCINKTEVEILCNGQCFITEIVETIEREAPATTPVEVEEIPVFSPFIIEGQTVLPRADHLFAKHIWHYQQHYARPSLTDIFHPPRI